MAAVINTNISSLNAQRNLTASQSSLATSLQRLSSGLRINSAKDDAAGLAISDRMTSQINGLTRAAQNANDGISMAQTAEGGLGTATDLLQRMRTLAVQSANGTNSASDRASLQQEVSQLSQELNRVANTTQFNGQNVLDGSLSNAQFQVGANANQTINFSISSAQASAIGNNTLTKASAGTMSDATTGGATTVIPSSSGAGAATMTVQGNGASTGALTITGLSAKAIADKVNAASGATNVTASALTTATLNVTALSAFGTVSLTLQGAPTAAGAANPISISATVTSASDLGALTKAINDQTGSTGITAIADATTGKIALTQAQGYDIGVVNKGAQTGMTLTGAAAVDGGTAAALALGAAAAATDSGVVGGKITYNSSTSFTATAGGASAAVIQKAGATSSLLSAVSSIDITTVTNGIPSGANDALQVIDSALANLSSSRASLGALQNRFTSVVSSLSTTSENLSAARSRILDADFASETANLTRGQILQQAGTAMLAQANALPNGVLALLRG